MKHRQFFLVLGLVLSALLFYFFTGNSLKKMPAATWQKMLPSYITANIFYDTANALSPAKIELGHFLFYDRRLSINKSKSCASCHDPKFSFTDGYRRSVGAFGDLHQRNASPLINIIFRKYLTAADSGLHYPEQQIGNPLFHDNPVELGWKGHESEIIKRIEEDAFYREKFRNAFPGEGKTMTEKNIRYCISTFIKTIVSFNSRYDQYRFLKKDCLTGAEKNGMQLFFSAELGCSGCHGGVDFATPAAENGTGIEGYYFNTGLYNTDGAGSYPGYDQGLIEKTHNKADMGKYRVPTLRNLAFTGPYYHDGSAASLDEIIRNYAAGGRLVTEGPLKGNGIRNPFKSDLIKGFSLTSQQRKNVIGFLLSLSDSSLLNNKDFANPFEYDETQQ